MRIGLVTKWLNRGQSYVSRQIRSALDGLGHETFVLARRSRDRREPAEGAAADPEWGVSEGVTWASAWDVPAFEYERWAKEGSLDIVLFDNCFQFDEIAALRASGVRTAGRFVWEMFAPTHVAGALEAFDAIYSLTACEQRRYGELGIDSPRVRWGIHPELFGDAPGSGGGGLRLYFPGGLMGPRKPRRELLEAFSLVDADDLTLVIKAQSDRHPAFLRRAGEDPRIEVIVEDMPTAEHRELLAGCDALLAPSRWEGLGVFLYEAIGLGMPIVTNDHPPMNEVVVDGFSGLLVASTPEGHAESGIAAVSPDVGDLAAAIERLRDEGERARLSAGALEMRGLLTWERTVADLGGLVAELA